MAGEHGDVVVTGDADQLLERGQFISAASACAFDVLNGLLSAPFGEDVATAYAHGAFVGAARFDSSRPDGLGPLYPTHIVREL